MPRISKSERISLWLDRLNRYSQSGQSVSEFCFSENISPPSFYQWKRRLLPSVEQPRKSARKSSVTPSNSFTELAVASPLPAATLIRLPHGVTIELGAERTAVAAIIDQVLARCLAADANETSSC